MSLKNSLIIFPSIEHENETADVVQQTVTILSQSNRVIIIDFLKPRSLRSFLGALFTQKALSINHLGIEVFHPIYFIPESLKKLFPLNLAHDLQRINIYLSTLVLRLLLYKEEKKFQHQILWLVFPQLTDAIHAFKNKYTLLYDIVDFYDARSKQQKIKLAKQKQMLLENAHVVTAISNTLRNAYFQLSKNKKIEVVPQGFSVITKPKKTVEFKRFKKNRQRPLIGFVGKISNRLDVRALEKIANQKKWDLVLIGPVMIEDNIDTHQQNFSFNSLLSLPNVYHISQQPKNSIPEWIKLFDICIIPYDTQYPFNKNCYPMKFFEYLYYSNAPLVSSPIIELTQYPKFVTIANDPADWSNHIKLLLKKKISSIQIKNRKEFALANTWQAKIDAIFEKFIKKNYE